MTPRETFEALRAAWVECRCVAQAEAVEEAARAVCAPLDSAKQWQAVWIERARQQDPIDLPLLMDRLLEHTGRTPPVVACLDEIASHMEQPQLTPGLVKLLELPVTTNTWVKVHTRIFKLLEQCADPRALEPLAAAARRSKETTLSGTLRHSLERASATRERLAERFPRGTPAEPHGLHKHLAATLEALRQAPKDKSPRTSPASNVDTLRAAIWNDPFDDSLRHVLADVLQERGDPYGVFIALQLKADDLKAQAAAMRMLEGKVKAWVGGIAKAVVVSTAVFEKGFLVACDTDVRRKSEADQVFTRPEWATVKKLRFRSRVVLSPTMRSLTELRGVTNVELGDVAQFTRLEVLHVTGPTAGALRGVKLPELRELVARVGGGLDWVHEQFGATLETMQTSLSGVQDAVRWMRRFPRLRSWRMPDTNFHLQLSRTGDEVTATAHFSATAAAPGTRPLWMVRDIERIEAVLDGQAPLVIGEPLPIGV